MSEDNTSANDKLDNTQREHRDEENPRFGRGRRGNQEENGESQGSDPNRRNDSPRGPNKGFNRPDSDNEKNSQNNQENSETSLGENQQDQLPNRGGNPDKRGDAESFPDGRGGEDNRPDEQFNENEDECDDQQGNPNRPPHDFSDSEHGGGPNHRFPPPDGPRSEVPSDRAGFLERASAYTITFSSETMFEVFLGSLLILVGTIFLFVYLAKRQRRKSMRHQYPVQNIQFVTPNQNIATSNFYQYYQKEGVIPTGRVVGYIAEGQFLQPDAKKVENLKSFGRFPTQDEILDLS